MAPLSGDHSGSGSDFNDVEIRILRRGDHDILNRVAEGVFDNSIDNRLSEEFLGDPRHHLAVAIDGRFVVGIASAVHYVHPDKSPQLWINEVGVAPSHRGRGFGKRLMTALLEVGRHLGCSEAWVLTDRQNHSACRLYESIGCVKPPAPAMFTFQLSANNAESPIAQVRK
ncbi:GNAT family N-acetyltransferase [Schlesneria paludicola]|uniref:GNAT family N-acetyltransferase n=1 Tax=Schlesneria paludicola TaxID=360056 RepID=UPI00029AF498|nr:GNAT family N-acetyltransferase [Schlesneria paludicola]